MPGLAGFVSSPVWCPTPAVLPRMGEALQTRPDQTQEVFQNEKFGVCQVTFPFVARKFTWNHDRTVCLALEGELYDGTTPEDLLQLYEERGIGFAEHLNGAFVAALWDAREHKLVVSNDIFGLLPFYFAHRENGLLFSTGIQALLKDAGLSRDPDRITAAIMVSCEFALGNRTLLKHVQQLPSGSTLVWCDGEVRIRTYWKFEYGQHTRLRDETEWIDDFCFYLRQAVNRQAPTKHTAGVMLSGGLDSRFLAGVLANRDGSESLRSLTFGLPGSDEIRLAKEVAGQLRLKHEFRPLSPDYLARTTELDVGRTGGQKSCVHMHAVATLHGAENPQVLFKGYMGDILAGSQVKLQYWGSFDRDQMLAHVTNSFNTLVPWDAYPEWLRAPVLREVGGCARSVTEQEALASYHPNAALWMTKFWTNQREQRFILLGVDLVRSEAIVRTPFCDRDFTEFMLTMPPGLLSDESLYCKAFIKMFPDLAKVPWLQSGTPLVPCFRKTRGDIEERLRWTLINLGIPGVSAKKTARAAEYDLWMRTSLRSWVQNTLLSPDALDRTILKPDVVHRLVREQLEGRDHSRLLGVLLAQEIWQRQVANA